MKPRAKSSRPPTANRSKKTDDTTHLSVSDDDTLHSLYIIAVLVDELIAGAADRLSAVSSTDPNLEGGQALLFLAHERMPSLRATVRALLDRTVPK